MYLRAVPPILDKAPNDTTMRLSYNKPEKRGQEFTSKGVAWHHNGVAGIFIQLGTDCGYNKFRYRIPSAKTQYNIQQQRNLDHLRFEETSMNSDII